MEAFTVRDGLGQSQVYSLFQDSRGLIWIGTGGGGLSCFDSQEMTTLTTSDGLCNSFVNTINELPNNRIFIGGEDGPCTYNGISFNSISSDRKLPVKQTSRIGNDLFINTGEEIICLRDDSLTLIHKSGAVHAMNAGEDGSLLWIDEKGLHELKDGNLTALSSFVPFSMALTNDLSVHNGVIYCSTYGHGVYQFQDNRWKKDPVSAKSKVVFQTCFFDDEVWFCTLNEGVIVRNGQNIRQYSMSNGLSSNTVHCAIKDDWGNVWVGTSGGGVVRFSGQQFKHIDKERGLPGNQVYSVLSTVNDIYLGVADMGLFKMRKGQTDFEQDSTLNNVKVKSLLQYDNQIWAGTEGNGVYVQDPDTAFWITRSDGLGGNWIRCMTTDQEGSIFIGTAGGGITKLYPLKSSPYKFRSRIYTSGVGLNEDRITDLEVDHLNRIWYSTVSNGLGVIFPDGSLLNFGREHGLRSNSVRSLELDSFQHLWIGTNHAGLNYMDLTADTLKIEALPEDLFSSKNIYFIQKDANEDIWVGTEKGVDWLQLSRYRDVLSVTPFSEEDGYEGIEACSNASHVDAEGQLWFGTVEGFSTHMPGNGNIIKQAPKLSITNVNLFYQSLRDIPQRIFMMDWGGVKDSLIFTYKQNHVSFDFRGVHQQFPEDVQYQWILEGQDRDWSPLNKRTTATFSNLKPGEYTFLLRSCLEGGKCTELSPIVLRILQPFWQKNWFIIGSFSVLIGLLFMVFWARLQRVRKGSKEKAERLRLERDVIDLEQKALRLQMNPHFIFNTLNSIQGLIACQDEKTARLYLSKFSRLMRQILENSREDIISLSEEFTALKSFLEVEQFTHQNCFEFRFESDIDESEYGVPPLIIQPFVENAIIHGIVPRGNGSIVVKARAENGKLILEVEDDGVGREKSSKKQKSHKSTGLEVTKERLALLLAIKDRHSSTISFHDLDRGTMVRIALPQIREW